jgi:hypothetical protein
LDALGRGLLKEFPNSERTGCPGSDVLKKIASKRVPLAEAEKWLNHLGSCSPCYKDFSELRKGREVQRNRTLLAIAASILVAVGIASWVLFQRHNEPLGSPEGAYEVRIVTASGDSLLNTGGPARLNDGVTSLRVRGDVIFARPGPYSLQIRKPPSEWSSYPLVLR